MGGYSDFPLENTFDTWVMARSVSYQSLSEKGA